MQGLTLIGLGAGSPSCLCSEARDILAAASEIWVSQLSDHARAALPMAAAIHFVAELLPAAERIDDATIVEKLLELGQRPGGAVYVAEGSPLPGDRITPEILRAAALVSMPVKLFAAPTVIDSALLALGPVPSDRVSICGAESLAMAHVPPFPPDAAALIVGLSSAETLGRIKRVLGGPYPSQHRVGLIRMSGAGSVSVETTTLGEVEGREKLDPSTCLFIAPLAAGSALETLQEAVARLRAPDGCPWDREQTHASLRPHLLEEAYEAIQAMDAGDPDAMREEFGDILLQIMLNSQIAAEHGAFTLNDVSRTIYDKIIRRHPHVFGKLKVDGVSDVLVNWERIKESERNHSGSSGGVLDGVPLALPALSQAQEYQDRVARVGFDWPELEGVLDKVAEEIQEVREAADMDELTAEMGDLLFALVNLARWKGIDAESALRATNRKFRKRFDFIERGARKLGRSLADLTLDEMEGLWVQAKGSGN